jgi:hypothetical protein
LLSEHLGKNMDEFQELYFRDQFRLARATAFRDAEAFHAAILCLERLGLVLTGKPLGLSRFQAMIENLAYQSPLASFVPKVHQHWHIPFSELYEHVREARNEAVHEGAVARHLTEHALKLLLVLEDAIMSKKNAIRDFMVRDPVTAFAWQPISFVREQMLTNGFSFIPIHLSHVSRAHWGLVSEYAVARYLRHFGDDQERRRRLAKTVDQAIESQELEIVEAEVCSPTDSIQNVLPRLRNVPILVIEPSHPDELVGIVTAFDFM